MRLKDTETIWIGMALSICLLYVYVFDLISWTCAKFMTHLNTTSIIALTFCERLWASSLSRSQISEEKANHGSYTVCAITITIRDFDLISPTIFYRELFCC